MSFDSNLMVSTVLTIITIAVIVYYNNKQYSQVNEQLKIQNRQIKMQNEQIKLNFFSEYTRRYQEIFLHFPEDIYKKSFSYKNLDSGKRDTIMRYMRVYFDLCSEEFFLCKNKYLDEKVWKEWEEGMNTLFNKPAFKLAWERIIKNSNYFREFKDFVNSKIYAIDKPS